MALMFRTLIPSSESSTRLTYLPQKPQSVFVFFPRVVQAICMRYVFSLESASPLPVSLF